MQNFRFSTAQVKPHQICTLIDFFLLKVYKISAKKVQRSYVSWYWGVVENLKILFFFPNMRRICWILIRALKSLKNLHIYIYIYIYHGTEETRKTENLKKNQLVVWKVKGGIWKIFIRAPESVKIVTFMESFCPK